MQNDVGKIGMEISIAYHWYNKTEPLRNWIDILDFLCTGLLWDA